MQFKSLILGVLLAASLPAHAVLVTSAASIPGPLNLVDFEAYDNFEPTGPETLAPGVVFTGDAGSVLGAYIADLNTNGLWGAGNRFAATAFTGELRFTFQPGPTRGAGAFVNHFELIPLPFSVIVSAYGNNNQIIETHTHTINTTPDSLNDGVFLGIVRPSADIRSISFKGNAVVVDNLTFTTPVPEPETWAMMLGGLGLIGFVAARRKAAK